MNVPKPLKKTIVCRHGKLIPSDHAIELFPLKKYLLTRESDGFRRFRINLKLFVSFIK